jgi:hypothetical protein
MQRVQRHPSILRPLCPHPHQPADFKYQVSLTGTVVDADKHAPIAGATVTAALESACEARAQSVVIWLKDHGIQVDHLDSQGFAATRPVADNASTIGRALNRRVEVSLSK